MDLQAILNESDSSLDDARPSSSLSDDDDRSHHVDLERILREDDDDDDERSQDDDGNILFYRDAEARDPTNMSMSTISTAAHHYHLASAKQATTPPLKDSVAKGTTSGRMEDLHTTGGQRLPIHSALLDTKGISSLGDSRMSSSTSKYSHSTSHNAEDWAVLQQILGEDDDDDDDDEEGEDSDPLATMYNSRVKPKSPPRSMKKPDIDAILNYIDNDKDDLDENLRLGPTSFARSPPRLQQEDEEDFMLRKLDTSYLEGSASGPPSPGSPRRPTLDIGEKRTQPTSTLRETTIRTERPVRRDEDDVSSAASHETVSAKAIAYAEAYEQRLLRPSQRDIVSPLMVKRRLKPKIELGSRVQQQTKDSSPEIPQLAPSSSATSHAPRYGFSGIMENKVMPGLTKQLQENEANKEIGLPTALAVNSKFIAIGTQRGIVIVFDLFEVLRQKLGHRTIPDGSWTKGQGGAVTSIDIADNGEALIAGYTSGVVVLWDIIKGLVLRKITDTHPSPITAVRFLPTNDLKVVTVDAGGLVNKLTFSRNIIWTNYSVDNECLLDGTAGQILAMNVLPPLSSVPQYARDGPSSSMYPPILKRLVLIALSSGRSSFAVAVEPAISVLHRWAKPDIERIENPGGPEVDEVSLDLPEGQPYLPCLSWGWALVSGGGHVVTPILARAWGCCVQLLRASFPDHDENGPAPAVHWPAFGIHDEFQVSAPIVALEWMGERSLVQLTLSNELMVVDTVMMTLVERLDFSHLRLVYAEFSLSRSAMSAEKRVINGGYSDEEPTGETYCSTFLNSIRSSDSRLLVLCQAEVKRISLLGARQRISALEQDGEWLEALALALDHYENTIKSQEDRRRDPEGILDLSKHPEFISARRSEDEEWIAKLLIRYLNLAVENAPEPIDDLPSPTRSSMQTSGRLDLAQSHYQMLAGVCIEFCVVSRRLDLLFGPIFRRFHAVGYLPIFLDVLEPYVLNDKLKYIAPEAMAYFVEHCKATSGVATVERCLLHMDVTIVDFDSILSLLRRNEMYSALSYVYTHGLDDFVAPLEIMLDRVFDSADEGNVVLRRRADGAPQNDFESVGYKTIVYLRHCFQGKDFPQGATLKPEDKLKSIRPQLLRFLLREKYKAPRKMHTEVLGYRTLPYPYTHILLMVDARALLDTLSLALDAPDEEFAQSGTAFESIGGWEVEVGADSAGSIPVPKVDLNASGESDIAVPDRQLIITMLSSIILPDGDTFIPDMVGNLSRNKGAVDAFLDFMSKYLLQGVVRANKSVTFLILSRMANRFAKASRVEDRQLAQEQIIELITALPRNAYEPDDVLRLVEGDGIHRAALVLHQQCVTIWHEGEDDSGRRSHHFQSAIDCYLEDADADFRKEVFAYAKKECATSGDLSTIAEPDLRSSLCSKLRDLVNLDAVMSAQLVAELYIDELDRVIHALEDGAKNIEQFKLLNAVISGELAKVDPVAGPVLNANLTIDHHQTYLTLMAKHHPDLVYQYLSTHDNYRPEECLKLCQKYEIADASAYLLERMGNVSSALQLILQKLEGRLMGLKRTMRGMSTDVFRNSTSRWLSSDWNRDSDDILRQKEKQAIEIDGVKRILIVALDLCERNSGAMARNEQSSQLWFNTLDRLINAKGFLRLSKEQPVHAKAMAEVLGTLLQMTMQRMVSSVPMPDLVRKVTTDHSGSRLGELREMIESLLGTYGFELQVCSKAVKVMNHDVRVMEQENRRLQMEGSRVDSIMDITLDSKTASKHEALSSLLLSDAYTLVVGQDGNALCSDDARHLHQEGSRGGFGDALHRLRKRRESQSDNDLAGSSPWDRPQSGLSMLSQSDQLYNVGESSEAAFHGVRVGVLGAAEHYGSFS